MSTKTKAYLVGGGFGSLAAAAFVFTVEYSVRAAQMAVYELLDIGRKVPLVTPDDESFRGPLDALIKAFD